MTRVDVNRSGEMEMFCRVVEQGGFSAAARHVRMTPSAVSKLIARLEARLGTRLVHRSTRRFALTGEGQAYYDRAVRVLADLDEADRAAGSSERPSGRVRINSSASYVIHVLARILPGFLATFPEIDLDVVQTDAVVDLVADRTDIAIRAGALRSSRLMARKLGETPMMVVAAPQWIDRHGHPATVEALSKVDRIGFGYVRAVQGWPFLAGDAARRLPAMGRIQMSDGEGMRQLALAGIGVARLALFTIRDDVAAGRLVPILQDLNPGDVEPFHAVFVGQSEALPVRARVLLDYLAEHGRVA